MHDVVILNRSTLLRSMQHTVVVSLFRFDITTMYTVQGPERRNHQVTFSLHGFMVSVNYKWHIMLLIFCDHGQIWKEMFVYYYYVLLTFEFHGHDNIIYLVTLG